MQNSAVYPNDWLTTDEAFETLGKYFRTKPAFQYHLSRRSKNGLLEHHAVRKGPLGLVVNPARFHAWLIADDEIAAA